MYAFIIFITKRRFPVTLNCIHLVDCIIDLIQQFCITFFNNGEVAGDEELVTGKEDETVDGSRVRKAGEVAADEEVVKTGDNNHVWVYIVILVAAAVISGTVIVISKKSNKR